MIISKENITQEFRLEKIDKIRNYLNEEINQNELTLISVRRGGVILPFPLVVFI